ncbi:MAG TPA: sensor histidine kinase [Allosphingosinicella sp.]|nr:sensor histidine kinase [Allosphingosinicella sp.]
MNPESRSWLGSRWERMSSGLKMFLIMSLGLLPLGLVAVAASVYSATENSEQRAEQTLARLDIKAQRLNELLARTSGTVRAAAAAIGAAPAESQVCARILQRLSTSGVGPTRYAFFDPSGTVRCATTGFSPASEQKRAGTPEDLMIAPGGETLRLRLFDAAGATEAVVEFDRETLARVTYISGRSANFNLELIGAGQRMWLRNEYRPAPFGRTLSDTRAIGDGRYRLHIQLASIPIRPVDLFVIILPVIMLLAAAVIGWLLINRLVIEPLGRMHRVVANYQPGEVPLALPAVRSPAREIAALGDAFDRATRTVARHEAELGAAIDRQTRLVREVHHRVKNNLQVVASLLNLHSRGAANEEVAAAYASIQRRVDALAVVHRNHYAELEENRGVALKPLISELAANLRATAPTSAALMQIRLDVAPVHASQDAAVSVAFLVTEIVEFGMLAGASLVSIVMEPANSGFARLSIEVDSLSEAVERDDRLFERFDRIVTGLARQLRSTLEREPDKGRYSVLVSVMDRD